MISGDHLLGRVSLFFDYGHSPDPVGEFLASLDRVDAARARTSASPVTAAPSAASRPRSPPTASSPPTQRGRVRDSLGAGPKPAFDDRPRPARRLLRSAAMAAWGLQLALAHLDHLERTARPSGDPDGEHKVWELTL